MNIMFATVSINHKKDNLERARFQSLTTDEMFNALDKAFDELINELSGASRSNAGFKILLAKRVDSITEIVLGQRETDGEYVTWVCYGHTDYNWGHYFGPEQLVDAMADFIRRVQQNQG